jgi:predicted permease
MGYILQVLCILVLMLIGFVARRRGMISAVGTSEMVRVMISIVYPCLVFSSITNVKVSALAANWIMPVMAFVIAWTGLLLGLLTIRCLRDIDHRRAGAFLFQSTINNYLFLPLPLILLMHGTEGVALLVFASVGFEIMLWTIGVFLFNRGKGLAEGIRMMFGPPLIAMLLAIAWVCIRDLLQPGLPSPAWLADLLEQVVTLFLSGAETVGKSTIAFSMIVSGSRIAALDSRSALNGQVFLVSAMRLVVTPVVFILILKQIPMSEMAYSILCIVAVMPAAVTSLVFSERFQGDSNFIASTLLTTHLGAIVTIPLLLAWAL